MTELPDELLVYDLERHRAHCLNPTAALVFKHCDGRRSVEQIARIVRRQLNVDTVADESLVWLSLEQLEKARLMVEQEAAPAIPPRLSRRELARRVALVALPVVATILAPRPAEALASGCVDDCAFPSTAPATTPCCTCGPGCVGCEGDCLLMTCDGAGNCVP